MGGRLGIELSEVYIKVAYFCSKGLLCRSIKMLFKSTNYLYLFYTVQDSCPEGFIEEKYGEASFLAWMFSDWEKLYSF